MSVVTALSLVLFVGFVATGLVGFLGVASTNARRRRFSAISLRRLRSTR